MWDRLPACHAMKYLIAIAVCLFCLIVLQNGCSSFGERFRQRIDDRREKRQNHWQEFRERFRDPENNDSEEHRHIFRYRWQQRQKESSTEPDDAPTLTEESE